MQTTKECRECGQTLDAIHFHKKSDSADGLYPFCKNCRRAKEGHEQRRPPKVRDERLEVPFEELVKDVFSLQKRRPQDRRIRDVANALRIDPYAEHSDDTVDLLYQMWEARQKNHVDFMQLNEKAPTLCDRKLRRIANREFTNTFE